MGSLAGSATFWKALQRLVSRSSSLDDSPRMRPAPRPFLILSIWGTLRSSIAVTVASCTRSISRIAAARAKIALRNFLRGFSPPLIVASLIRAYPRVWRGSSKGLVWVW